MADFRRIRPDLTIAVAGPRIRHTRRWAAWLLGLLLATCAAAGEVRVATLNLMNYLCMDRRIDGRFLPGHPKPEHEKAAIREILRTVRADVLCLQEIGPRPFLDELRQDLDREGLAYAHAAWLEGADPLRHVAVLSRLPFREVVEHDRIPFRHLEREQFVKRGMLEVHFDSAAGPWRVFVLHLKSPLTEEAADPAAEGRRTAEARAVRDRILVRAGEPGALFLVAGDINATPDSRALAALTAHGKRTVSVPLRAADSRGETWTHRHVRADSYERRDYILVSPVMKTRVRADAASIFDGPGALDGTDHRLVWVDLDLGADVPARETTTPAGAKPAGVAMCGP